MDRATPGAGKRAERTAIFTWIRLARIFQKMNRAAAAEIASYGLSTAQFDVIAQLGRHAGITQQELANRLLVTKGNVSQLISKMEERGLITRCPDGRANALSLTAAGQRLFEIIVPSHEARVIARFGALTPEERQQLLGLLRVLDHALE